MEGCLGVIELKEGETEGSWWTREEGREGRMRVKVGDGGGSEEDMNKTYRYREGQEVVW